MDQLIGGLAALAIVGLLVWERRRNELFVVSIRGRRVLLVRGRVPHGLLHAFHEVAVHARLERGTIRGVRTSTHVRLVTSRIPEGVTQRLRNVLGLYPIQRLRAAPRETVRNVGQILGIAWLAWLLVDRGQTRV